MDEYAGARLSIVGNEEIETGKGLTCTTIVKLVFSHTSGEFRKLQAYPCSVPFMQLVS